MSYTIFDVHFVIWLTNNFNNAFNHGKIGLNVKLYGKVILMNEKTCLKDILKYLFFLKKSVERNWVIDFNSFTSLVYVTVEIMKSIKSMKSLYH